MVALGSGLAQAADLFESERESTKKLAALLAYTWAPPPYTHTNLKRYILAYIPMAGCQPSRGEN